MSVPSQKAMPMTKEEQEQAQSYAKLLAQVSQLERQTGPFVDQAQLALARQDLQEQKKKINALRAARSLAPLK